MPVRHDPSTGRFMPGGGRGSSVRAGAGSTNRRGRAATASGVPPPMTNLQRGSGRPSPRNPLGLSPAQRGGNTPEARWTRLYNQGRDRAMKQEKQRAVAEGRTAADMVPRLDRHGNVTWVGVQRTGAGQTPGTVSGTRKQVAAGTAKRARTEAAAQKRVARSAKKAAQQHSEEAARRSVLAGKSLSERARASIKKAQEPLSKGGGTGGTDVAARGRMGVSSSAATRSSSVSKRARKKRATGILATQKKAPKGQTSTSVKKAGIVRAGTKRTAVGKAAGRRDRFGGVRRGSSGRRT